MFRSRAEAHAQHLNRECRDVSKTELPANGVGDLRLDLLLDVENHEMAAAMSAGRRVRIASRWLRSRGTRLTC